MGLLFEQIAIYGTTFILIGIVLFIYIKRDRRQTKVSEQKIDLAKEEGYFEPVTLYPFIDPNRCIKSGACVTACPEKDVLGIRQGRATTINASHCIGHGACFKACPMDAISLRIGTERRGVDIPHISTEFETNIPGIYVAGELGGMGLIKNAITQGMEAIDNIAKIIKKDSPAQYDVLIVGAGPAGISATLTAKKHQLKVVTLEQETLGGTIATFPRSKIVMTSPVILPLYGKVKMKETTKPELLNLWMSVLSKNKISIHENSKVESIIPRDAFFEVKTASGDTYTTQTVLLAIGRRGSPRKLGVPGEMSEKVAYRLLEPEEIRDKKILVVGGGDSAIESALMLAPQNQVTLSYRGEMFNRLKTKNAKKISEAMAAGTIKVCFNTNVVSINSHTVTYRFGDNEETQEWANDLVYIFAGGELPTQFLIKTGINISTKRGETILKH